MKASICTFLIAILISLLANANAKEGEKILVHFTGFVNKPGFYQVDTKMTMLELREACGGLSEFATTKRMMVIRFPRAEGLSEDRILNPDDRKDQILRLDQIPKEGDRYLLKDGDIVYFPAKYLIGH